jgi:hypothetical protein
MTVGISLREGVRESSIPFEVGAEPRRRRGKEEETVITHLIAAWPMRDIHKAGGSLETKTYTYISVTMRIKIERLSELFMLSSR